MNREQIAKAEAFLHRTFEESPWLQKNPSDRDYRLEHSYRVANIAKTIAEAEGYDVTCAVIAGLLHDMAYCEEMPTREDQRNHGRRSAALAKPFLMQLGLSEEAVHNICYAIAIHVDDEADFLWTRTAFSEVVGDADNLDRFDAYRIYETLQYQQFSSLSLEKKRETADHLLGRLKELRDMPLGSATAKALWLQRLDFYIEFYEKLHGQLRNSNQIF